MKMQPESGGICWALTQDLWGIDLRTCVGEFEAFAAVEARRDCAIIYSLAPALLHMRHKSISTEPASSSFGTLNPDVGTKMLTYKNSQDSVEIAAVGTRRDQSDTRRHRHSLPFDFTASNIRPKSYCSVLWGRCVICARYPCTREGVVRAREGVAQSYTRRHSCGDPVSEIIFLAVYRGTSFIRNAHSLGLPWDPGHRPTIGS